MDKQLNRYRFGNNPAVEEKRGRARLVKILLFTVIFFTLLSGTFYGLSSSLFNLQELVFDGNEALTVKELEEAFPYPTGTNIWQIDLGRVEKTYASLPRTAGAQVERRLPRGIHIFLEEKETAAVIPYQGYYYEVAADGTLLGMSSRLPPGGFPMLTELTGLLYRPGENITVAGGELAVSFLQEMGEEAAGISEINAANPNNLIIFTVTGQQIWMGRGDYGAKLRLLPGILAALPGNKGYVDFRALEAPSFVGD